MYRSRRILSAQYSWYTAAPLLIWQLYRQNHQVMFEELPCSAFMKFKSILCWSWLFYKSTCQHRNICRKEDFSYSYCFPSAKRCNLLSTSLSQKTKYSVECHVDYTTAFKNGHLKVRYFKLHHIQGSFRVWRLVLLSQRDFFEEVLDIDSSVSYLSNTVK